MQVIAGGRAGRADASDDLSTLDLLSDADQDRGLVRVAGREPASVVETVVDAGEVAVAAVPAGPDDASGRHRPDRGAASGREVDPGVQQPLVVDRVEAQAEVARLLPAH